MCHTMAAVPGTRAAAFGTACLRQGSLSQGACLHRLWWISTQAASGRAFQQRACWARAVRPRARRWDTLVTRADKDQVRTEAAHRLRCRVLSAALRHFFAETCCQVTTTETEEEELPVWARREVVRQLERQDGVDLPFGVYLLASALVAIAAVSTPRRAKSHWLACEHCCPVPALCGGT